MVADNRRDAALRRLSRANRWLVAGSMALTGVFAEVAASAFPGKTVKTSGTTGSRSHAHTKHSSKALRSIQPPAQVPQASTTPEPAPSQESAPAEKSTPSQESGPKEETAPSQESAPTGESAPTQESAPREESAPAQESAPP